MEFSTGKAGAVAFDRERSRIFLEKADLSLSDDRLARLPRATDAELGIDGNVLGDAMRAFDIAASAHVSRAQVQGTFHRLYDVAEPGRGARLLRVAAIAGPTGADLMALECQVITQLRKDGFPVPECDYRELMQAGAVRGVHLAERAPGVGLNTLDDDEERTLVALGWIARFLADLHQVRGAGFGPLSLAAFTDKSATAESRFKGVHPHWDNYVLLRLSEHLHVCKARGAISSRESSDIAARFAADRFALRVQVSALLHGDPGSHNFVVDESGIRAVIDWEDTLLGDPLFDLASLCTFHPERRHATIWAAYGAHLTPGDDAWTRYWLYFLRIALAKTVHRFRFGYADRPGRPPASLRIQLALTKLEMAR